MKNLRVYIENDIIRHTAVIWVIEESCEYDTYYNIENGEISGTEVKKNDPGEMLLKEIKPFMVLPYRFANALFKAMAESLNKSDFKPKNESLIEGKLIATELHLSDMRDIAMKLINRPPFYQVGYKDIIDGNDLKK